MSVLGDTLRALAAVLDGRGVQWYVFGAQAVLLRGSPRATQDIDVTVSVEGAELRSLVDALETAGFRHRYPELAQELLSSAAVLPFSSETGMEVDMVIAGSGLEALAMERAERIEVEGTAVPVASTTDLIVMKVLAGRGKDLDDVRALLASGDADVDEAKDLLSQLEQALGQSDLVRTLDEAILGE